MNATSIAGRVLPNLIADKYGPLNSEFPMVLCNLYSRQRLVS